MASINERLEAEPAAPFVPFKDDRILSLTERLRLEANPCVPIFMDPSLESRLELAYDAWMTGCRSRSRSIPVTVVALAERPRAEGHL